MQQIVICGNKMPTRCNRVFYCTFYCLLNMFRASLCPSPLLHLVGILFPHINYDARSKSHQNSDLLVINSISTCFGKIYAHHQEIRMRSTAYSCLSCCSCCDGAESGGKMCALCGECCLSSRKSNSVVRAYVTC